MWHSATGSAARMSRIRIMTLDSWIAVGCAASLLVYLMYTLLRPERF
jgi:K+-transporting ATPase KdpF subunit